MAKRSRAFAAGTLAFVLLLVVSSAGPRLGANPAPVRGTSELQQLLIKLHTTARLMHTVAHPDDEDGGMLVLEARGEGVTALQLTLTRGEGGQNRMGSNFSDELGVLRTLELLAADQYYGVEQRFTRVADFGYSKSATETFEKWHGYAVALADMVRVIRTFRPDVIVSRFQGTARDGHGNHQASGILTAESNGQFRFANITEGPVVKVSSITFTVNAPVTTSTQTSPQNEYTLNGPCRRPRIPAMDWLISP